MISFVKFVAVLSAVCVVTGALAARTDDGSTPKPEARDGADKKKKKGKPDGPKKPVDVPVEKGHDSFQMFIPYFDGVGKRQMNFRIGVASRLDDNHIKMKDLQIETFDEEGKHEMGIDLPTSVLNTETSIITTDQHVTIRRDDFELTGETMVFNTVTKQGGLGGNVRMLIYNLKEETDADVDPASKPNTGEAKKADDTKTTGGSKEATPKPEATTPRTKAK